MWIERWDDVAEVPFMYKSGNWVSYDNEKSIAIKVRQKNLYITALNLIKK